VHGVLWKHQREEQGSVSQERKTYGLQTGEDSLWSPNGAISSQKKGFFSISTGVDYRLRHSEAPGPGFIAGPMVPWGHAP
jgi:hypothetical protein